MTAFASIVLWLSLARPEAVEVVQLPTTMGGGEARIIFRLLPIDVDVPRTIIVKSADGKSIEFKTDMRDHPVKVPSSFPDAIMIRVDTTPILLVLKKRERVYFIHDHDDTWSFISASTSTTMGGKAPTVICVPRPGTCPEGYIASGDPQVVSDSRCPEPTKGRKQDVSMCYRPGRAVFRNNRPSEAEVALIDHGFMGPGVLRQFRVGPGNDSEPIPIEYDSSRPVGVRIDGREYFFAIDYGGEWLVTIGQDGVPTARAR